MTALPQTTRSRLKNIPQTASIWEGDRRPLENIASQLEPDFEAGGECIIWVDGMEGSVRAMDVVPSSMGIEAIVRTLLRAIESPQHPTIPARPQKIIVRDREIQFFLRGALQELEIEVEYAASLPLIDRLFEGFERMGTQRPPALPPLYQTPLENAALRVWQYSPWELLADSDILEVKLTNCGIDTIYLCIIGMLSSEYGVLFYRSLESLKQFRCAVLSERRSETQLEKAFLAQDCWFLNYDEYDEVETDIESESSEFAPMFGSLHPYEGIRAFLDEEEAKIVYVALETLLCFCDRHCHHPLPKPLARISETYQIELPSKNIEVKPRISTTISTLPEVTAELLVIATSVRVPDDARDTQVNLLLQDNLVPDDSLVTIDSIPWKLVEQLKQESRTYCQCLDLVPPREEGLPIILIQTTRPKAKATIERIKSAGGLRAICFNPGKDPYSGDIFDLGILQTQDGELYIFAEYDRNVPQELQAMRRWHRGCQKTQGYCGLIVSMGAKGNSRGNPQLKDMLGLFETKAVDGEDLGMGTLELMPNFEF
ncbi:DUF6930 domain-containing protein [Myxosarcina sp. GI1(2024)]